MNDEDIPPMTPELWIENLIDAACAIADKEKQERCWLAPDAQAWERPEELICVLFDDCNFELFIEENALSFSTEQSRTASEFANEMISYIDATPPHLNPTEVLADPRWLSIREKASAFAAAFKDKWPTRSPTGSAD